MLTRLRSPRVLSPGFLSLLLLAALAQPARPAEGKPLTNSDIVAQTQWKMTPAEIVALIDRNETQFDVSADAVKKLKDAGVAKEVLDAMRREKKKADALLRMKAAVGKEEQEEAAKEWLALGKDSESVPVDTKPAKSAPLQTGKVSIKPPTIERLADARNVVTDPGNKEAYPKTPEFDEKCPLIEKSDPRYHVDLDWKSGSVLPSRVDHAGNYCFAIQNVNNILYSYSFTLNRLAPQGDDLSLLKGAVGNVKDFATAAAPAEKTSFTIQAQGQKAPTPCAWPLEAVTTTSAALDAALSNLVPGADSAGKPNTVPLGTTIEAWKPIPEKFGKFESAVGGLIANLRTHSPEGCEPSAKDLQQVEAAVLDGYVPARTLYLGLVSRVTSQHVARYSAELDNTEGLDVVVQETLDGKPTAAAAKTYHLDPGRKILTASAGFVLTTLHARSYSSVTAPDPADSTKTSNVLGVDGGRGVRPALAALLNYHIPWQPSRNIGLAISAGPLFDIANGKADTSHFGFFGGLSVHLWNRLYLTPGIHVGEFADYPLGFAQAGQSIPTGMGTPVGRKRYTAHFAFGITFKASELGIGSGNSDSGKKAPATQPKP